MNENSLDTLNKIISYITLYNPYFDIIIETLGSFCNLLIFTSK